MKQIEEQTIEEVQNQQKDYFNRSTLEVAKSIIDDEKIATRSKKYLNEEKRLGFLSVWTAFNTCFSVIADIYEAESTSESIKDKLEAAYLGIPTGFNLPLESRVPPEVRGMKLAQADEKRKEAKAPGPIIVKGYNDPESLEMWEKEKSKQ